MVDPEQVIRRYQELHNLRHAGNDFGMSHEWVRQIVNRAGISTARIANPKPEKEERFCKQCGAPVNSTHAHYCETHRTPQQQAWRRYQRIKADPERYAQRREILKASKKRRRGRNEEREGTRSGSSWTSTL